MPYMRLNEVYKQIRQHRQRLKLNQDVVAKSVGVSLRHFIRIEKGEREPTFEQVQALAATFRITVEELLQAEIRTSAGNMNAEQLKDMIRTILTETKQELLKPNITETRKEIIELIETTRQDDLLEVLKFIRQLRNKRST